MRAEVSSRQSFPHLLPEILHNVSHYTMLVCLSLVRVNDCTAAVVDSADQTRCCIAQYAAHAFLNFKSCHDCRFFKKKLGYIPEHDPDLPYVRPDFQVP